MKVRSKILSPLGILAAAVLLGSGGTIILVSTNQVSNDDLSTTRWEPSSAAGTNWAHSWLETTGTQGFTSFAAGWTGSRWSPGFALTAGNGQPTQDVNIAWDPVRSRFVLAAIDNSVNHSVWYGVSTDSTGTSWTFTAEPFVGESISMASEPPTGTILQSV